MSDEIKDKTAAETIAENMTTVTNDVVHNATSADQVPPAVKVGSAKGKKSGKPDRDAGALKTVGLTACKRHGLAEVWVTSDGQVFPQQGDAKAHAANLTDKELLNVKAK